MAQNGKMSEQNGMEGVIWSIYMGEKIKGSSSFLSGGGTSMNEEGNAHL